MELRIDIGYDRKRPLYTDVCLSFVRGDIINVVGDNGSGKSTLALQEHPSSSWQSSPRGDRLLHARLRYHTSSVGIACQ